MATVAGKRGPTVLVTDAREQQRRASQSRPSADSYSRRSASRLITVDNVLQYASDIPSMQQRFPQPGSSPASSSRPQALTRTRSGKPNAPRLTGRLQQPHIPPRTTKVSEKLVLLPEAGDDDDEDDELGKADYGEDNDAAPERDDERARRQRAVGGVRGKSYAERLPKDRRADKVARCTAYCTAQAYRLEPMAKFLREQHGARTKLYDDCLYVVYHRPLLPGEDGWRVRSSPILKSAGGKAVLDEEIERSEQRDYVEGYFEEDGDEERFEIRAPSDGESPGVDPLEGEDTRRKSSPNRRDSGATQRSLSPGGPVSDATHFAEMYVFSYGVAVFWNFSAHQEKDVLADLTFYHDVPSSPVLAPKHQGPPAVEQYANPTSSRRLRNRASVSSIASNSTTSSTPVASAPASPLSSYFFLRPSHFSSNIEGAADPASSLPPPPPEPLVVLPLASDDFETEEFHFEYSPQSPRPRVFNDMITLRSGDHMIKLTISHAIAQSTKLSFFEAQLAAQMEAARHIPRALALTGELGLGRRDVHRVLGATYRSRVDVNLSSPVLDTPTFFWASEPTLGPLYDAVREYLEISSRVKVLNERCRVFLDLAEMLEESKNDQKMSHLTWIIIVLIGVSIFVTCTEVFLRFGMLNTGKKGLKPGGKAGSDGVVWGKVEGGRCVCQQLEVDLSASEGTNGRSSAASIAEL